MARAAGNTFLGVLGVLLLLPERAQAARGDAPSIGGNLTITPKESPWCKFEAQVNGKSFLWYNCSQKRTYECYIQLTRIQATKTCNGEEIILKELMDELKKIPLDTTRLPTLLVEMTCQWEDNGRTYGSWFFYVNGSKALRFDSKNGKRTPLNSDAGFINDTLNHHKDVTDILLKNPTEMCKNLYERVWNHRDSALNTAGPVTSESTTEPPTSASATDQSKTMYICIIVGIIILLIILGICVFCICRRRCCRRLVRQGAPSGGCVGQDVEASFLPTPEIPGEPSCSQSRDSQLPADWRERSPETLCLEQRPATHLGSPQRGVCLSDSDLIGGLG